MGKGINGEDLGKGYYQKANGLYYAKKGVAGEEIYDSDMNLEQLKRRVNKRIKIIKEGPGVIFKNATLNEWFMWWYEKYKAPRLAEQSAVNVLSKYKNIMAEQFGDSKLKLITELDVIDFLEDWTKNPTHAVSSMNSCLGYMNDCFEKAIDYNLIKFNPFKDKKINEKRCIQEVKDKEISYQYFSKSDQEILLQYFYENNHWYYAMLYVALYTGMRVGDDDDKIRLNQRKPSKYKGLSRFGPEKNLQRINKFMKERPIFYKNLIQMKENFRFYLRCFYCITKVVILQFNSENRTELARNG